MSKRRALLVHELPQKKPRCVPEAQPGPGPVLALHRARELPVRAPAHVQKRRKSSRCCREEEEEEEKEVRVHEHELLDREPPRKLTAQRVTNCNRASGTFSGATRCTEQHAEGTPAKARARRKVPLANHDEDLHQYNSFQFWRNPLPVLDLTLLDNPSRPDSTLKDIAEAMET